MSYQLRELIGPGQWRNRGEYETKEQAEAARDELIDADASFSGTLSIVSGTEWWTVELDDGTGAERVQRARCPIDEGQILDAYGQRWIVNRVDPDILFAHARPTDPIRS